MTKENIAGGWVPVSDCLPSVSGRYWIKSTVGSITPRPRTRLAEGKMTPTGFRFLLSDWEVATAWLKETPGAGAKFMMLCDRQKNGRVAMTEKERAEVLYAILKPCLKKNKIDRFDTAWGDKTILGLYRTIKRIMEELGPPASISMLDLLKKLTGED